MPGLTIITDRQFEMFIRRAINTSYGRGILAELTTATGKTIDCVYIETPNEFYTEDGAGTPKAEPSGAVSPSCSPQEQRTYTVSAG